MNVCKNLKEAYSLVGLEYKPMQLDVKFLNPFIHATESALEIQADTPIKRGKPYAKTQAHESKIGIAGVLNISSTHFNGAIALCFPSEVFLKIYENMLGEKHDQINDEMEDAAAELLNIIYGMAKKELNDIQGCDFNRVIPTILRGEKLMVKQATSLPVMILPFESDAGPFHIEIAMVEEWIKEFER